MRTLTGIAIGGIVVAIVIGAVSKSTAGDAVALVVGGVASVLGVCLAFYAVGVSEDRERARRSSDS